MTQPNDRRWNGRLCALTRTRPSRRSPLSLRLTPAGQAAAGFASGRKPNWPRIRCRRPRSPHFLPASRHNRARARSPRRAPRRRRVMPRRRRNYPRLVARGHFDALTESVILREFGAALTKADHAYRADRLFYAGYLSAGARAAALAGPDVSALALARIGGGSRADERRVGQGGSVRAAQRSRSPVLQDPVRPARGPRLRGGGHAEPRAARSRRGRQSGSMVERAQAGRQRAARPRRAATCVRGLRPDCPARCVRGSSRRGLPRRLDRLALP